MTEQLWTVVIPVKGTPSAKSRLGGPAELAEAIALDSVEAALAAATVERVLVVTTADAAPRFAAVGAEILPDPGDGLNAACRAGIAAAGAGPIAVLLGDVPSLQPKELEVALRRASAHPRALVPDAEGDGTVLITAIGPADHAPAFGVGSRSAHLAAGYLELDIPTDSGLRRDVDTAVQLAAIPVVALGPRTRVAVERLT